MWGKQVRARSWSCLRHLLPAGAGYSGLISVVASINPCAKCMDQDLSSVLEDVQVWVLLGHDFHSDRKSITRLGTRADIAEDSPLGDNDYVGRGPESVNAPLRLWSPMNIAHDNVTTYSRNLWKLFRKYREDRR